MFDVKLGFFTLNTDICRVNLRFSRMNEEIKKIKPEDIYVSRLKGRRVKNEEGWERMEEFLPTYQPVGDILLDRIGILLLVRPVPTVRQLAASLDASIQQVNTYFNLRTGMDARDFLNAYKLLIAKELLTSTDLTMDEIGRKCNFSGSKSFTNFFLRNMNMGPATYRKRNRPANYRNLYMW